MDCKFVFALQPAPVKPPEGCSLYNNIHVSVLFFCPLLSTVASITTTAPWGTVTRTMSPLDVSRGRAQWRTEQSNTWRCRYQSCVVNHSCEGQWRSDCLVVPWIPLISLNVKLRDMSWLLLLCGLLEGQWQAALDGSMRDTDSVSEREQRGTQRTIEVTVNLNMWATNEKHFKDIKSKGTQPEYSCVVHKYSYFSSWVQVLLALCLVVTGCDWPMSQEPGLSISLRPMKYQTQAIQWASRANMDMSSVRTTALYWE